jgi:hypothetical protein
MWEDDWIWVGRPEKIRGGEIEEIAMRVDENQYKAGAQTWSDNNAHNFEHGPSQRWMKKHYSTSKTAVKAAQRFVKKITPILKKDKGASRERVERLLERSGSGSSSKVQSEVRSRGIDR